MLGTINKLGVLGTVVATVVNLGCCAGAAFGPLTGVLFAGGFLYRVPLEWQFPILYGSLAVALVGFGMILGMALSYATGTFWTLAAISPPPELVRPGR